MVSFVFVLTDKFEFVGYSSRQSSARRSKSRNGSRPGSRKSRNGSRNGCRSTLPPVDKPEHPVISHTVSNNPESVDQPKTMAVSEAPDTIQTIEIPNDAEKEPTVTPSVEDEYAQCNKNSFQDSLQSTGMRVCGNISLFFML